MLIGILGGGQLARMMALAGIAMGLRFRVLDHGSDCCASAVAEFVRGEFQDLELIDRFSNGLHAATFDFENVPADSVTRLATVVPVRPGAAVLRMSQDRVLEKQAFQSLGIAVGDFMAIDDLPGLCLAAERFSGQMVLKTRRLGYDGKGQARVRPDSDLAQAFGDLGGAGLIAEAFVPFQRELSLVCTRGIDGAMVFYPLVENVHIGGVLALTLAPAKVTESLSAQAHLAARRVADAYSYVGTFAIEFFELEQRLLVNEMAPRVHNSGHWSIEGAVTSQFENHLRAVLGWPLGTAQARSPAAMINFLGQVPSPVPALRLPGVHWHDYGKAPRAARKVGHVTMLAEDSSALVARIHEVLEACELAHWKGAFEPAMQRLLAS